MNRFLKNMKNWIGLTLGVLIIVGGTGCGSTGYSSSRGAGSGGGAPGNATASDGNPERRGLNGQGSEGDVLRIGDPVSITFSGVAEAPAAFNERLKADGLIKLPLIKDSITAVGKTRAALEAEIHGLYVPNIFKHLTVKVGAEGRIVNVDGEVRMPGRVQYLGEMTVLRVIAASGGFTDFANRKKVLLRRANGSEIRVNCLKALEDSKNDPPVFPEDYISVPRRYF
jgi:polysaccharide export outer membrane protein